MCKQSCGPPVAVHQPVRKHQTSKAISAGRSHPTGTSKASGDQWIGQQEQKIDALFAKYGTSGSDVLHRLQLKILMADINETIGADLIRSTTVDDQDVDDLMKICDPSSRGSINRQEVLWAVEVWRRRLRMLPRSKPVLFVL